MLDKKINNYLEKHRYKNVTTNDFIAQLTLLH